MLVFACLIAKQLLMDPESSGYKILDWVKGTSIGEMRQQVVAEVLSLPQLL